MVGLDAEAGRRAVPKLAIDEALRVLVRPNIASPVRWKPETSPSQPPVTNVDDAPAMPNALVPVMPSAEPFLRLAVTSSRKPFGIVTAIRGWSDQVLGMCGGLH